MRVGIVNLTPYEVTETRYRLECTKCDCPLADSATEASAIGNAEHHSLHACDSLRPEAEQRWPLGPPEEKPEPRRRRG